MSHLYLFTLEIVPLEVGRVYDDLPAHLTLMSRFLSDLTPGEVSAIVESLCASTKPINIVFGSTIELGPKKVIAHMVDSPQEKALHEQLRALLDNVGVAFQYPQFTGQNHKAHVTQRDDVDFPPKTARICSMVYLIEVIDGQRIVRSKFNLDTANGR